MDFLLHSNLYGKRPADYAVSLEMLEIFQEASERTQHVDTSLSPSASLSVVTNANNLLYFISLEFLKVRLLMFLCRFLGKRLCDEGGNGGVFGQRAVTARAASTGQTGGDIGREDG